jgi:hypothetical protein
MKQLFLGAFGFLTILFLINFVATRPDWLTANYVTLILLFVVIIVLGFLVYSGRIKGG